MSPDISSSGSRFEWATAAAVTMFVAPGPIDEVAIMIWRRRIALAKPTAASAMPCSFWPRHVGSSSLHGLERLPEARHVAVPEDREHAGEQRRLVAVDRRALGDQVLDDRLGGGQLHRACS